MNTSGAKQMKQKYVEYILCVQAPKSWLEYTTTMENSGFRTEQNIVWIEQPLFNGEN